MVASEASVARPAFERGAGGGELGCLARARRCREEHPQRALLADARTRREGEKEKMLNNAQK
jgi:hypothetical protein